MQEYEGEFVPHPDRSPLCPGSLGCIRDTEKDRQSKQPQLWPKLCHKNLVSRTEATHTHTPPLPGSLYTHPNQLPRDKNEEGKYILTDECRLCLRFSSGLSSKSLTLNTAQQIFQPMSMDTGNNAGKKLEAKQWMLTKLMRNYLKYWASRKVCSLQKVERCSISKDRTS